MAAPEKNKFAIGNSGREKLFTTKTALKKKILEYFKKCDENRPKIFVNNEIIESDTLKPLPYTIEGLCNILQCSRRTLLNYQKQEGYEEFFHTIEWAKMQIIQNKVERAHMGDTPPQIAMFDLINNTDYKSPTQNIDHTSDGQSIKSIDPIKWLDAED